MFSLPSYLKFEEVSHHCHAYGDGKNITLIRATRALLQHHRTVKYT